MNRRIVFGVIALFFGFCLSGQVVSQDSGTPNAEALETAHPKRPYSPYAGGAVPTRVFWGETHLHTAVSMDAGAMGARLGPEEAYQFARGEEIESSTAGPVRLARPLDFLVVADHSDNMGFFPDLFAGAPHIQPLQHSRSSTCSHAVRFLTLSSTSLAASLTRMPG
jgi:hypothetical protein